MRWFVGFLAALIVASAARSEPTISIEPWTEAVISVSAFEPVEAFLVDIGRWKVVTSGAQDLTEHCYYGLPSAVRARSRLLCAPDARDGCIRLVRYRGAQGQRPVRLATRPWDTGGLFSVMMRTDNLERLFDRAIAAGWWAESEPIGFRFGGSDLRNVVLTGPHGINIAVYQRLSPPFTAFPVAPLSKGFNAMRMVRNQPLALKFYTDILGFKVQFDADYLDPEPQPSNFSIPHNLTTSIPRRAAVAYPQPGETGRIEVMQFTGLVGKDVSAHASPPNLGILSLRFPVSDAPSYARLITARGGTLAYGPRTVRLAPYGRVILFAVRDPDGALTEFYQRLDP